MLVPDSLLVDADSFDGEAPVVFAEPAGVELVVWDEEEEEAADCCC